MTPPSGQPVPGPAGPEGASSPAPAARPSGDRRLSDLVAEGPALGFADAFPRGTLILVAALAALLVGLHFKLLNVLVRSWGDINWQHGYIIPLFSIYLLYSRREEIYAARRRPCLLGLFLMLASLAGEVVAVFHIRNYWLAQIGMLGMLAGLTLYLGGWSVLRLTWLPIGFLIFAMPIPTILYQQLSVPLQNLSAKGSVVILEIFGVDIEASASRLEFDNRFGERQYLTVAEACSGIRLLMAFVALGVATAYLDYKPVWQRILLVLAAVPIAVFCNVIRVTITCWMFYLGKAEFGKDFMHHFTGLLMLVPAFGLLWAMAWVLKWIDRHLYVDADDADDGAAEATA